MRIFCVKDSLASLSRLRRVASSRQRADGTKFWTTLEWLQHWFTGDVYILGYIYIRIYDIYIYMGYIDIDLDIYKMRYDCDVCSSRILFIHGILLDGWKSSLRWHLKSTWWAVLHGVCISGCLSCVVSPCIHDHPCIMQTIQHPTCCSQKASRKCEIRSSCKPIK